MFCFTFSFVEANLSEQMNALVGMADQQMV